MPVPDEIRKVMEFPLPLEKVWKAVSTPEGLAHWFSDRVEVDETGQEYKFIWEQYGTERGTLVAKQAPTHFAFRWGVHGYSPGEPFTPENSTLVTFTLDETPAGTRLTVRETGFAGLAKRHQEAAYKENNRGWDVELGELQQYLTTLEAG